MSDDERRNREVIAQLGTMLQSVFVGTATEALRSIKEGSELTGAPGQPVDTGNLRNSWLLEFPDQDHATISTNVIYAEAIEDGTGRFGPLHLRSSVGGWHSVAATAANIDRIVESEKRKAVGQ